MADEVLWVKLVAPTRPEDLGQGIKFVPDVPDTVTELRGGDGVPKDKVNPAPDKFLSNHIRVRVSAANAKRIRDAGKEVLLKDVPVTTRLTVEMIWASKDSPTEYPNFEKHAGTFFDSIDMTGATVQFKQDVKDVLLQTVARGLSEQKAESIRVRLGLPEGGEIGSGDTRGGGSL